MRVIRACREMGIASVAVYSDLDRDALHVRLADEAYALGGSTAAESYLRADAIVEIAESSKAEAIHPGYGFLSENADFARAVTRRGITFVGPPPAAIDVMGDKLSARSAADRAGVSGVPGTSTPTQDVDDVAAFGASHGWPVAIKAAYGGGGRGMKVVAGQHEASDALESARREALAYFGRDELYLERYFPAARHVEVQVLADSHGNCIYLGTRDCSAQRRHQKLIEEAPAPDVPPEVLTAMGEAATDVARGCGYVNAGTVEFLYAEGSFFYLEMNTRLQVEHPVTEMVTGVDLVEQQLLIASGEPLTITQDDVAITGHAIEVRINAEDPANGAFLPCPGTISALRVASGYGTRWDGGYESGDRLSEFYDNLIGKLIVWGRDRPRAIGRALRALDETEVTGVATTMGAAQAIIGHDDFATVNHTTRWVEDSLDLSGVASRSDAETSPHGLQPESASRRKLDVEVDGKRFEVGVWVPDQASAAVSPTARRGGPRHGSRKPNMAAGGSGDVTVPMQGTIVKVLVEAGDTVEAGDVIVVLEAMKMENNVLAPRSGTVSEVRSEVGDSVGGGDTVAVIS